MARGLVLLLVVALAAAPASAESKMDEPWYRGPHGRNRVFHLSLASGMGLVYIASESLLKPALAPDTCRWCEPPTVDVRVRNALVWDDYERAHSLSNWTGYVATPLLAFGLSAYGAIRADDAGWGRVLDDAIPVLETVTLSQVFVQIVKFSAGRARPFVHFRSPPLEQDHNLSFFSGHSALTFGLVTSAGMVAHWRESRAEPVIWAVGMPLAAATAYLRIAADRHYFTDVLTGTLVGIGSGLTIPRMMRRYKQVSVVPTGNGIAFVGAF